MVGVSVSVLLITVVSSHMCLYTALETRKQIFNCELEFF